MYDEFLPETIIRCGKTILLIYILLTTYLYGMSCANGPVLLLCRIATRGLYEPIVLHALVPSSCILAQLIEEECCRAHIGEIIVYSLHSVCYAINNKVYLPVTVVVVPDSCNKAILQITSTVGLDIVTTACTTACPSVWISPCDRSASWW